MLVMVDDVKLSGADTFFPYISMALGKGADGIKDENDLYDVLSESKNEIEIMINDLGDVAEEFKKFAKTVVSTCMDAKMANKKIKIDFVSGKETAASVG